MGVVNQDKLVPPRAPTGLAATPLIRRRYQFVAALILGALLPFVGRGPFLPGTPFEAAPVTTLIGNIAAITLAFWMRLSLGTYPGIRSSRFILPTALSAHAIVVVAFLLTRLPYDRLGLGLGVVLHILWNYLVYFRIERQVRKRIAIIPYGAIAALRTIPGVDWQLVKTPDIKALGPVDALVADFSADLPAEWEAFLADAALDGRIVFQVKQLSESLTGQVELAHLSENSFGALLPSRGYLYMKALVDRVFALLMVVPALLLMALAAAAILIDDGRPIFFLQKRSGHRGGQFRVIKFRTMRVVTADDGDEARRLALATDEADARVTRVGAFLRRYRIDEVPQIFNILRGEMSWIGPRPEPLLLSRYFESIIPFYRYRHVVKPGISGWAQVNQGYASGVADISRKLNYDFYYIKNFSPWLDILILFKTIRTMLTGFGAR